MPGKNLTRDEAAARAADRRASTTTTSTLDLTTGPRDLPHHAPRSRSRAASRAPPPSSTSSPTRSSRSPSTARASTRPRTSTGSASQLPGAGRQNELTIDATGVYMNTGEGLHRFVDPVDDEVYLYTQFEVADCRRMFAVFEQPDLKATFALHGDRPGPLAGRLQLPHARADPRRRGRRRAERHLVLRRRRRGSPATSRRSSPARTTSSATRCRPARATVPLGIFCRKSLTAAPRRRQHLRLHQARASRSSRTSSTCAYPFDEVRPDLHARVQHGRDGERRRRDLQRDLRLPRQGHRGHRSSAAP